MKLLNLLLAALLVSGIAMFSISRIEAQTTPQCPQAGMMGGPMMQGMHGPADHAYMQSMMGMHQGMSHHTFSGDADKDFMSMMIPHHQAAIDMARTELQYGKDPKVRAIAQKILKAQQTEIDQMTALLQ